MALLLTDHQHAEIERIAQRWAVTSFELFGSALDDRFGPESDVDLLVSFRPDARPTLFDLFDITDELEAVVGRPVDLMTRRAIEKSHNPYRKAFILDSARLLYRSAA
ncbi:nucleotidyltransferase family protein [Rubrivirga sp.]|uniref:nucleotidyltransferase family protein n=1 Tax=Rubrivirga sp. TaxID=1885344 RepID=UPI003C716D21